MLIGFLLSILSSLVAVAILAGARLVRRRLREPRPPRTM
jgi:hypothetical protein